MSLWLRQSALCVAAVVSLVAVSGQQARAGFIHDFDVTSVYQQGFSPATFSQDLGSKPYSSITGPAGSAEALAGLTAIGPTVHGSATAFGDNMSTYAAAYSVAQVGFHVDESTVFRLTSIASLGTNGGVGGYSDYFILLYGYNSSLPDPFSKPLGDMEIKVDGGTHVWYATLSPEYAYYFGIRLVTVSDPTSGGGTSSSTANVTINAVPEPSSLALLVLGVIPLVLCRYRSRRATV